MSQQHSGSTLNDSGESRTVLISGASFAGLATAWWMHRLGYVVTVVEIAVSLRRGGTPVDIRGGVVDVVRRMGLLERIASQSLEPRVTTFLDRDGSPLAPGSTNDAQDATEEYEIERDTLLDILCEEVKDHVEFVFGDSIASLAETAGSIEVTFASGKQRSFALLLGCDGTHSAVRKMCFGEEAGFSLFLQNYFSLTIVRKLLIEENTSQMFNVPGRTIMLNAYHGKTDIAFSFFSEGEISMDRRDRGGQKRLIAEHFQGIGWRTPELLDEMLACDDFYFDKLCQIRMGSWTRGCVALVGDAGYCPSPAAGMGGSMALLGAAALGDAFAKYPDDFAEALREYDRSLRPAVEAIQTQAVDFGLRMFLPKTEEEIQQRNDLFHLG